MIVRRVRGLLLRFVRRRTLAVFVGSALVAPALWNEFGARVASPWVQALLMVGGATGAAILWTGLAGLKPDWVETSALSRPADVVGREHGASPLPPKARSPRC